MNKLLIFLVLSLSACNANEVVKESISFIQTIVQHDMVQELGDKLGGKFKVLSDVAKEIGPILGPAGDLINFVLFFANEEDNTPEYFKNITQELNKINTKLDALSEQMTSLDKKITTSTKEIITEVRFQNFFELIEDVAAAKHEFELIIKSYSTNASAVVHHLNTFIEDYKKKNLEYRLVNYLDSGSDFSSSLVDKVISLYRQYQADHANAIGSSLAKTINDIYTTVLVTVIRGNTILEVATNTKIALTSTFYKEDKEFLINRKNEVFEKFYLSLEKTFAKVKDQDLELLINFNENGNNNTVRFMNVLQIFWEEEPLLTGETNTCSDTCEFFTNREYNGYGCNGAVRDCKTITKFDET